VLSLITYRDEAEAIRIANDTPYGLHGYVRPPATSRHGRQVARQIRAGRVMVNDVIDGPDAPFGGFQAVRDGPRVRPLRPSRRTSRTEAVFS